VLRFQGCVHRVKGLGIRDLKSRVEGVGLRTRSLGFRVCLTFRAALSIVSLRVLRRV
jgi:hypothetical protein